MQGQRVHIKHDGNSVVRGEANIWDTLRMCPEMSYLGRRLILPLSALQERALKTFRFLPETIATYL